MDAVHVHLAVNHVPVVGLGLSFLLLLAAAAMKSDDAKRLALGAFVLVALMALPAYFTGKASEDAVEKLAGVSEDLIDRHQDVATWALVGIEIVGVIALGGLVLFSRPRVPAWLVTTVLVLSLAESGLLAWTAYVGGQIRHTEIRPGAAAVGTSPEGRGGQERGR
jgi:hypothetical protein